MLQKHRIKNCFLTAQLLLTVLFTLKLPRFTLSVYEKSYKLHETKVSIAIGKFDPLYCNTITKYGANFFLKMFFHKQVVF